MPHVVLGIGRNDRKYAENENVANCMLCCICLLGLGLYSALFYDKGFFADVV